MRLRLVVRVPRLSRDPIALFLAASIAVHGAFALFLILEPFARHRAKLAEPSMMVQLAGPLPGPPAAATASPPGPPTSAAPPPEKKVEPPKPPKEPASTVVDRVEKGVKKKEVKEEKPAPLPAAPSPPAGPAPTGLPGGGSGVGGGGIGSLEGNSELAWYWASVAAALRGHWVRPVLEGSADPLTVTITFDVRRDGSVTNVVVESPSGVAAVDRSALRAIADASPLPPIPPSRRELTLSARYLFELKPGE